MQQTTEEQIVAAIARGENFEAIAASLGLGHEDGTFWEAGWWADDGNWAEHIPTAQTGREAAEAYVSDGDWGDGDSTSWVTVRAWRKGWRRVECVWCFEAPADTHDASGDPTCTACMAKHGQDAPEPGTVLGDLLEEVEEDAASHKVEIAPAEPDCARGHEHDWCSPYEVLAGDKRNPGVWGSGGGVKMITVCRHCGRYCDIDTWAQDPCDGEQGLTSVSYREADDASREWVLEQEAAQ